jgi:hypothetical protein
MWAFIRRSTAGSSSVSCGAEELQELRDDTTGEILAVFTCSDLPYQYLAGYFEKLSAEEFPSIENEVSIADGLTSLRRCRKLT